MLPRQRVKTVTHVVELLSFRAGSYSELTFVSDTDQKAWTVDNPETLKGHEGHHVQVKAHVNADKASIHIAEVKSTA